MKALKSHHSDPNMLALNLWPVAALKLCQSNMKKKGTYYLKGSGRTRSGCSYNNATKVFQYAKFFFIGPREGVTKKLVDKDTWLGNGMPFEIYSVTVPTTKATNCYNVGLKARVAPDLDEYRANRGKIVKDNMKSETYSSHIRSFGTNSAKW